MAVARRRGGDPDPRQRPRRAGTVRAWADADPHRAHRPPWQCRVESDWTGDDARRPLDDEGRAQADGLARLIARFDVAEIVSADVDRCAQTVAPLAEALGLEVRLVPVLSEVAYPGREDEALALVRALGGPGRDGVACSQGPSSPTCSGVSPRTTTGNSPIRCPFARAACGP